MRERSLASSTIRSFTKEGDLVAAGDRQVVDPLGVVLGEVRPQLFRISDCRDGNVDGDG
ncbi:hypothetical protein [Streptomyces acidiscabies]|uniref:hypothetical protein n=1 Tax=Streptomyces acidiscabies TaxID=42234 RepID=UPI0038F7C949